VLGVIDVIVSDKTGTYWPENGSGDMNKRKNLTFFVDENLSWYGIICHFLCR
jgi:hypothetical protein